MRRATVIEPLPFQMPPADRTLAPVTDPDFSALRELADPIWRKHDAGMISAAEIDSMLASRFSDEVLREQTQAADRWLELPRGSGTTVGYRASELADMQGHKRTPAAMSRNRGAKIRDEGEGVYQTEG